MKFLAIFIAMIMPRRVQYWAMLEYMDKAPLEFIEVETPEYTFKVEKKPKHPCGLVNSNICVAEGCYGEACVRDKLLKEAHE